MEIETQARDQHLHQRRSTLVDEFIYIDKSVTTLDRTALITRIQKILVDRPEVLICELKEKLLTLDSHISGIRVFSTLMISLSSHGGKTKHVRPHK